MLADMAAQMQPLKGRNQLLESLLQVQQQRQAQDAPDPAQVGIMAYSWHTTSALAQGF